MTKALHVRIQSDGTLRGTHVYDAADGAELTNVRYVRFDHRHEHLPIVTLELQGGELLLTEAALALAEPPQTKED